jgi:hypothetical protein
MIHIAAPLFAALAALAACDSRQSWYDDTSRAQAPPLQAEPPPAPTSAASSLPAERADGMALAAPKTEERAGSRKAVPAKRHVRMQSAASAKTKSKAPPGGNYRKVSELVRFPDFYPGLGQLWVEPATIPVGPFRAYDRNGELVSTILMVPLDDLNAHKTHEAVRGTPEPVHHIDMHFTEGHPGVDEPHYHIILWHVPQERVATLR